MNNYNPDVLSCLANLSNDEVFTPPALANQMLDALPQELFRSPTTRFLDPCTKSGVFLREIARRIIAGLAHEIPDLQERIDHIMHHQLHGIAITQLTSLMSRRSLYCSKDASGPYSLSRFDTPGGNIRFRDLRHTWRAGKCRYCGASQEVYDRDADLESHAYEFIHTDNPNTLYNNMTFDVIIGNPPYQLSDGGGMQTDSSSGSAIPLYHKFITQAMKLNPRYLSMIIPARWYSGGRGLNDFRDMMLNDSRILCLVDYFDSTECFPGVDISGGICYFLWDNNYDGECNVISFRKGKHSKMKRALLEKGGDSFIRFNEAIPIIRKIQQEDGNTFDTNVSTSKPFGMRSFFSDFISSPHGDKRIKLYRYGQDGYVNRESITQNHEAISQYKVYIAKAYGERGDFPYSVLGKPFMGEPNSCCTETYLFMGPYKTRTIAENVISYVKTRFFRFLVLLKKNTQNGSKAIFSFVPLQDFSKPWTDEELYKKYGLTEEEIQFIESMIRPME